MKMSLFYYFNRAWKLGAITFFVRFFDILFKKIKLFLDRQIVFFNFGGDQKLINSSLNEIKVFGQRLEKFRLHFFIKAGKLNNQDISLVPEKYFFENHFQKFKEKKILIFNSFYKISKRGFAFWHEDWLLGNNYKFYNRKKVPFFGDLKINSFTQKKIFFGREVKNLWEIHRLQNLTNLAYFSNYEIRKKKRSKCWEIINKYLSSLLKNEKYLCGFSWKNPMEVAIRAINICLIFSFGKLEKTKLVSQYLVFLKNHELFIQNYLETSVTPNNHYLADLLGLCFLSVFLGKKKRKLFDLFSKTEKAFLQQMQQDGSFYEGSTTYHRLNVEMIFYFLLLADFVKIKIANRFFLEKTLNLVLACSMSKFFLRVGDDDSGKVVFGFNVKTKIVSAEVDAFLTVKKFLDFGLVIVKNKSNLLSFRNFNFNVESQPSGHFNLDQLSINLVVNNVPVLISAGTGAYTSNVNLRNLFRSSEAHSTFFLDKEKHIFMKDPKNLFFLNFSSQKKNSFWIQNKIKKDQQIITLVGINYDLFSLGCVKERKIKIFYALQNQNIQKVLIEDKINFVGVTAENICWKWILGKDFVPKKSFPNLAFCSGKKLNFFVKSSLPQKFEKVLVSENYLETELAFGLAGSNLTQSRFYLFTEFFFDN